MITRIATLAAAILCAEQVAAQGVIRAGEHDDYTRLVVPIGSDRDFELTGEGPERRIEFDPPGEFETDRIFPVLYADRLRAVESDGGLTLELTCDCDVGAYRYQDEYLILDIYDGPELSPEEEGLASAVPEPQAPPVETPIVFMPEDAPTVERARANLRPYRPEEPLDRNLLRPPMWVVAGLTPLDAVDRNMPWSNERMEEDSTSGLDEPMGAMTDMAETPDMMADVDASNMRSSDESMNADEAADMTAMLDTPMAADNDAETMSNDMEMQAAGTDVMPAATSELDETANTLAEQLARATAAGLLEASGYPLPLEQPEAEPDMREMTETDVADGDPEPELLPVRAANAFDIAGVQSDFSGLASALSCSGSIRDLANWSSGLGFEQELGALRQAAFDADGNLVRGATIQLARYYIFHGFGAEAEAWLLQLSMPPETELAMARYLDDRPGPNFPHIETLALCSGLDLLWRFVDAPDFPELTRAQREDMRLSFQELPIGLRRLLGPDFVRSLSAAGYENDATNVRESLARGTTFSEGEALVLELETTDARPSLSQAAVLETELQTAGPDASRVMREYLAAIRRASDRPELGQVLAAEALLLENPPDRSPESLWHEVLLARAYLDQMDTVFVMLDEISNAPAPEREEIFTSVMDVLVRNDQDTALIVLSTRISSDPEPITLPRQLRMAVYDRLISLDLEPLAMPFATDPSEPSAPIPAPTGQNWVNSGSGAAAEVARRVAALEAAPMDTVQEPDAIRASLEDSQAMRAEIEALLGSPAAN